MFAFKPTDDLCNNEIYLKLDRVSDADTQKNYVPAYHFHICLRKGDSEIGLCNLRIGYNENLYYGGHIGYGIKKPYRGHHYAGKACLILFTLAMKHQMEFLYITSNPDNIASRKTCEYAGGILEKIVDLPIENEQYKAGDRQKCVYRFNLNHVTESKES
jgi:predicted acetyltransferase